MLTRYRNSNVWIIFGDFNAHHREWNCDTAVATARHLQNAMEGCGLYAINTNTLSKEGDIVQRSSNLNLLFASEILHGRITYFQVDDTWNSDHHPILYNLPTRVQRYTKRGDRVSTKKTKWTTYTTILQTNVSWLASLQDPRLSIYDKYDHLIRRMKDAVYIASGTRNSVSCLLRQHRRTQCDNTVSDHQRSQSRPKATLSTGGMQSVY